MSLQIFNTMNREKEVFQSLEPGKVKIYCCGPTVYDYLHIGNFRGAVVFNMFRSWLEKLGYEVTFVYNFTDVDDKILKRASDEGVEPADISEKYISEFKKDFAALKLTPHEHNPKVTDYMSAIVNYIAVLIEKGAAYEVDGEVYFSVKSFDDYGKLSHRKVDDLLSGVRIDVDLKKKHAADFTLWKPAKQGEQSWESPWGAGRPGWHIECSCMSAEILGNHFDIHGGGGDLLFPHHENEIAQSESYSGSEYAKYWMHNNMINFSGAKMSKSLGNIKTMRSFLEDYSGEIFKYLILSSHYRSESDFSEKSIEQAISGVAKFYTAIEFAETMAKENSMKASQLDEFRELCTTAVKNIEVFMNDDLNTPRVFAEFFNVLRKFNSFVKPDQKKTAEVKAISYEFVKFVREQGAYIGLLQEDAHGMLARLDEILIRQKNINRDAVEQLVARREQARLDKNYELSDKLRNELAVMGIAVRDTAAKSEWSVIK